MEEQQMIQMSHEIHELMRYLLSAVVVIIALVIVIFLQYENSVKAKRTLQMKEICSRLGVYQDEDASFSAMVGYLKKFDEFAKRGGWSGDFPSSGILANMASESLQTAIFKTKTYNGLLNIFNGYSQDKDYSKAIIEQRSFIENTRVHVEKIVEDSIIISKRSQENNYNFKKILQDYLPGDYELFGKFYNMINDSVTV